MAAPAHVKTYGGTEVTSASEEIARIASAINRTKPWHDNSECTSGSDEQLTTDSASNGHSMPNLSVSVVFDYATWLVGRMSHEQRLKLTHGFTWVDLCAGLGTPLTAYEAFASCRAAVCSVPCR